MGGGYASLIKYCRRLAILYLCWLVVDGWFVLFKRPYLSDGFPNGFLEFVKDLFFGTTFPGSWFLSALVVSVLLVYFGSRTIGKWLTLFLTLLVSLYVNCIESLPNCWHIAYDWYAANVRAEVNLSFPSQMVWVAIGMVIGHNLDALISKKKVLLPATLVLTVACYMLSVFWTNPFIKYVWVVSVCLVAFFVDLPDSLTYKRIRNYSILIFLFHFSIAGKMSLFCSVVGDTLLTNWLYYILVVAVSIVFAEAVLRLEKVHHLEFLKYLH